MYLYNVINGIQRRLKGQFDILVPTAFTSDEWFEPSWQWRKLRPPGMSLMISICKAFPRGSDRGKDSLDIITSNSV